jgi:glutamate/tyrosine decarboxylase-like PLP-dependent enzyme
MGAGIYLTRHPDILGKTFRVGQNYMPREARHMDIVDPFAASMQWSRRFMGLKVFLSLAAAGWDGYRQAIRRMHGLGDALRAHLRAAGWRLVAPTALPMACFVDGSRPDGAHAAYLEAVSAHVVASGRAWISTSVVGEEQTVLRACISSHRTASNDLDTLMTALEAARRELPRPRA